MKRHFLTVLATCLLIVPVSAKKDKECIREVKQVIKRSTGSDLSNIRFETIEKRNGCDVFEQEIRNNKLILKGSSGVALSRGFYDFLRSNELGQIGWSGSRIEWPENLTGLKTRNVLSPVEHHYYLNVVTYGYTTPYWDWARWEQEIDWMALHGLDMPLALVATEAISVRVWKRLGLTEEEISEYLVGPAHFPWMRMGNISGIDSPLPISWHEDQVKLQHQILKRMKNLGMTPICPGFAGFVPQAIKRIYPDLNIIQTSWSSFHNWMVSPQEELFSEMGRMFIEEWEKEFGKNSHYLVDSFNEMDVPFPPKGTKERYELLASYGEKVYGSIKAGNPDAVWVMQGWMFGYQRYIWDYETLGALVSKVPDDKMLMLDLAADYNAHFWKSTFNWDFHKGFFNKNWVYSTIPNMGGKTGFTGMLEFYANGHLNALNSPNRGKLQAIGTAPEGIENNEVIYELITDAGWSDKEIDLNAWLTSYTKARYGIYNEALENYWKELLNSVFGTFTDHPRFNWQFRPGSSMRGSIEVNESFFKAFEHFASCAEELKGNKLYETDLRENMAMYLGGKLEILVQAISQAYLNNDLETYDRLVGDFEKTALNIDRLLSEHPTLNLERWIDFARKHGKTAEEADYYERNARRIVTVWGPPVDDYSARIWSGLIRDYYLPRWMQYFSAQREGKAYTVAPWELDWVENKRGTSTVTPFTDLCQNLNEGILKPVSHISLSMLGKDEVILANWSEGDFSDSNAVLTTSIPVSQLKSLKGLRFTNLQGNNTLKIREIAVRADGIEVYRSTPENATMNPDKPHHFVMLDTDASWNGNNGCELIIRMESDSATPNTKGKVVLLQQ